MALTITAQTRNAVGGRFQTVSSITVDNSYPTGGWPLTWAQLGLPLQLDACAADQAGVTGVGGANVQYDKINQKLMVFSGAAANSPHAEFNNGTNLSTSLANLRLVASGR